MKIDYSKIFPGDISQYVSPERLKEIKKEANTRRLAVLKNDPIERRKLVNQSASEYAYLHYENQDKTPIEKALLAANMVFDDEKIVKIVESVDFDRNLLSNYIKILNYLKSKIRTNNVSKKDEEYKSRINVITQKLYNATVLYTGSVEPTLIINKIAEILSFNPGLFLERTDLLLHKLQNYLQSELRQVKNIKYVYYTKEKIDNKDVPKCNFILYGDNIDPNDLIKIASIAEVIKESFREKNININISISSTKQFSKSDDVNYLYIQESNQKVKINKKA